MKTFGHLSHPLMEFHLSRSARDRYTFKDALHAFSGRVVFSNFSAARELAHKMNGERDLLNHPDQSVRASDLHAVGLIDELAHALVAQYREEVKPQLFEEALGWLRQHLGQFELETALLLFAQDYPALAVYKGELSPAAYLEAQSGGVPHRHVLLEEMMMLWLANANPAFAPVRELFDDAPLRRASSYPAIMLELEAFFESQPGYGPESLPLLALLQAPALASPDSLLGQLDYIRGRWSPLLGSSFAELLTRVMRGQDWIKEEVKRSFFGPGPSVILDRAALLGGGAGPGLGVGDPATGAFAAGASANGSPVSLASLAEPEYERYSIDSSWMPRLVLMAKSSYVWLGQLSTRYRREIGRLDEVPDEELDRLAGQGFTGLWLIGLWERSRASKTVKQLMGNPDAVASAYSLYDYVIAADLGGEAAYENLRERAWARGIRLASDMVPNHIGIDGRWVIEHPHWFVSLDESPFPSYTFNGPDLSQDERVGIFLEDHYYDRSDAAVVFKRLDRHSGEARYIYHGNDGTSMAWNDTAQLDYLKAEVREAVIQTILHVAGKFPVIRFDAAMTLAKQHIQRLWYPHPGTGGAIASRAEHGMTKAEFDALMPTEFWREVVDRVAKERPDTLLLAEAFWMMEGYFVRTLGMHRVYNSAFMHMLKGEDNGKYRSLMKNVLEFDPEILKRFVNFMNNPDEETAVAQFGKDDKYFGVCLLMVTLPGLPMFGHGQVEGLFEKYGMEYRRARWQEQPNEGLIRRHEHEIFPLLHKRYLFAEVENFLLYDFYAGGHVNENVFAYSNRVGEERALVVFHNKFSETRGWIKSSVAFSVKRGEERELVQRSLAEGLGLTDGDGRFVVYRDQISGLEYLRSSRALARDGLYLHLGAFKYQVFMDFRELSDDEHRHYARLERSLQGRGVPSIEEARRGLELEPLLAAFRTVVNAGLYEKLLTLSRQPEAASQETLLEVETGLSALFSQLNRYAEPKVDEAALAKEIVGDLRTPLSASASSPEDTSDEDAQLSLSLFCTSLNLIFLKGLRPLEERRAERDAWLDRWFLSEPLAQAMRGAGLEEQRLWHTLALTRVLLRQQEALEDALHEVERGKEGAKRFLAALLDDPLTRDYLLIHPYEGANYFNKEAFEQLCRSLLMLPRLTPALEGSLVEALVAEFEAAQAAADYKVEALRGYFEEAPTDEADADEAGADKAGADEADKAGTEAQGEASVSDKGADGVGDSAIDTAKDSAENTAKDTMKGGVKE